MATIGNAPLGENTSPAASDKIPLSGSVYLQLSNLLKIINLLTTDSSPDRGADYVATYDASAGGPKKVLLNNLGAYALQVGSANDSPADATTYYFGCLLGTGVTTTEGRRKMRIPRAGTITRIDLFINCSTGSSETSTISFRLNGTTDTTISSAVNLGATPFEANVTGLSIAVAAGDYFEIKWVTPTWATNPTAVNISALVYIS